MDKTTQSLQGECPSGDYKQAGGEGPKGSASESPAHRTENTCDRCGGAWHGGSPCTEWTALVPSMKEQQSSKQNCRDAGPGRGLCAECASGHYERCLYLRPSNLGVCGHLRPVAEPQGYTCLQCEIEKLQHAGLKDEDTIHNQAAEIERLQVREAEMFQEAHRYMDERNRLRAALESIAGNTCCDRCQEAALVAKAALKGDTDGFSRPADETAACQHKWHPMTHYGIPGTGFDQCAECGDTRPTPEET